MWTPRDTDEASWRAQHAVWERMGGVGRLKAALAASDDVRRVSAAGIRHRHPEYDEEQVRQALLLVVLGDELYGAAFPDRPALPA